MTQTRREACPSSSHIMQRLLAPDGCPWDREQTLETLRPYVIEEAHEVVDAIDRKDMREPARGARRPAAADRVSERAGARAGRFGIDDVIGAICDKMVRRHPHVFGDEQVADSAASARRAGRRSRPRRRRIAACSTACRARMPALLRALRVGEKAAHLGLDWPDAAGPARQARRGAARARRGACAAAMRRRHRGRARRRAVLGGEPGAQALRRSRRRRCGAPSSALVSECATWKTSTRARGVNPAELPFAELDALWNEAKQALRGSTP